MCVCVCVCVCVRIASRHGTHSLGLHTARHDTHNNTLSNTRSSTYNNTRSSTYLPEAALPSAAMAEAQAESENDHCT